MNQRLPALKGKEVIKALKKVGFIERRTSGGHCILKNSQTSKLISVPMHGSKDIKRGTLYSIIKQVDLSVEEFINLL